MYEAFIIDSVGEAAAIIMSNECNIAMVVSRDLDPTIGWMIATVVISRLEGAVAPTSPPQPAPSPPPP